MTSPARQLLTAEEYLAIERAAECKSEFFAGEMRAMPPANHAHNLITANITAELSTQLKSRPGHVYASAMRVKVSETGLYVYPDVVVVCGERQLEDEHRDTLLNPTLIVEVLSPSTESYDRGDKFDQYRQLESLQEYVLIAQDRQRVERYVRRGGPEWVCTAISDPQGMILLNAIGCELALAEVYDKVDFSENADSIRRGRA